MDKYSNKDEIYSTYSRAPCAQQQQNQRHFISYTMPVASQPQWNAQPVYNLMYGQSMYRNQNAFSQTYDSNWDTNNEKNKDTACCRIDNIPISPDFKNVNYYNKNIEQWFYGSATSSSGTNYTELPSCSQITEDCCIKDNKYCSVQKVGTDSYLNNKYENYPSCSQLTQSCNLYQGSTCLEIDKKILLENCEVQNSCEYYQQLQTQQQQTDFNLKIDNKESGESDIVVEDSDELTDETDTEKDEQLCFLCNGSVINNQFYTLGTDNSVTTSFSQSRVDHKLKSVLGGIPEGAINLCSACMGLVNTMDNLEMQLEAIKNDLISKFKTSKNYFYFTVSNNNKVAMKKKATNKICGLHSFRCSACDKVFSLRKFYHHHMSKHKKHKSAYSYLCEHCGCGFIKYSNLKSHLRRHLNNYKFRCSKCNKGFIYENSLKLHRCFSRKFMCHICGKIFKTRTRLKEHENICSGLLPYCCKNCSRRFPSKAKLKHHSKLQHDKKFTVVCDVCNKGFVKNSDYKTHMLVHSSQKNNKCNVCGKSYKSLSNLNQHLKVHNETMPFNCSVCGKGFLRKENLESHLNIHSGLKPFMCSLCDKRFASQKNLDAHIKVHNGTVKKKTCPICGKQISHGLDEHLRTHSNIKEFDCVDCNCKFSTKGALAKHKKRKHVIDVI